LLTMKAMRALQSADIILYDDLVSPEVLELARREARRMLVGKTGHGPSCKQSDINALMVKLAAQGRHVVRLKSGDPLLFGRATEEIEACRLAGLPVAIVPGITAAQGAAASLGISLTERRHARRVQMLTGHGIDGALPVDIAWPAIADPTATTILYMPRRTLAQFRDLALAAGLDPQMPALAIQSATRADEAHVSGTITTLPDLLSTLPDEGPVLVMIGRVLRSVAARAVRDVQTVPDVQDDAEPIRQAV
jgi:uroporphyrin-III C-methyltransferase / precorrin-2 dehydrogenase / sirohydrochlorin ferrochelatase